MVKKRIWKTAVVVLTAAVVYLIYDHISRPVKEVAPPPPPDETPVEKILRETTVIPDQAPPEPSVIQTIINIVNPPDVPEPPPTLVINEDVLRLNSSMIIASVNGVAITLRDLVPVNPSKFHENSMGREMYDSLLERAINRELVSQEARRLGLALTEVQKQNLEKIRQRALEKHPNSFTEIHDEFQAKAEFEVRDFAGLMLQETLLAASGGPPKYATPDVVQQYYNEHKDEFGELPEDPVEHDEAWRNLEIEIRSRISTEIDAHYQQELQRMLDGLKQQANIQKFVTVHDG